MFFEPLAPSDFSPFRTLHALRGRLERLAGEPNPDPLTFALYARDDSILLRMALPGIEAKDLGLEIDGRVLTLSGTFGEEPEVASSVARHVERPRGAFTRALQLPFEADAGGVEAHLERGVLEVRIPRLQKEPAVRIQVRSEVATDSTN